MHDRTACFANLLLLTGLLAFTVPVTWAEQGDHPTASKLFVQFMDEYEQGDYEAARKTAHRIDPLQLPSEHRVTLFETTSKMNLEGSQNADAPALLKSADSAMQSGRLDEAKALYGKALEHDHATEQQKLTARARLAGITRLEEPNTTRARDAIAQATNDIRNGNLDAAERKLQTIQKRDVKLGWFDQKRYDRQLAMLAERRDQAAHGATAAPGQSQTEGAPTSQPTTALATTAPAATPRTAQTTSTTEDDVLARAMKQRTVELIAKAESAEGEGQLHIAAKYYEDAVQHDPTNEEARAGIERTRRHKLLQPEQLIDSTITTRVIRIQAVKAEYEELIQRAEELRSQSKYTAALQAVSQAKIRLDQNEHLLPAQERQNLRSHAVALGAQIQEEHEQRIVEQRMVDETEKREAARKRRIDVERETQAAADDQLFRALGFHKEQRYDEALRLVEQALFLQPNNPAAQLMQAAIEDSMQLVNVRRLMRRRSKDIVDQSRDNLEATIPMTELLQYPDDWPQITNTRLSALADDSGGSEMNRRVELKLQDPLDLPFENNELANVIDFLRRSTDLNIFVNWPALETAGISKDLLITLQLRNVPAKQALTLVLAQASAQLLDEELTFSIIDGIVNVSTANELTRETSVSVYDIRDLLVQVPNFDNAPDFDLTVALENTNSGGGGRGGGGGGGGGGAGGGGGSIFGDQDDNDDEEDQEEKRLQQIEDISTLIRETVGDAEEWAEFGGTVSSLRELNGNLIVKTTPQNHTGIRGLLLDLRETRAIQIHVEGRFLLVDQNFIDEFLMDVDFRIDNMGGNFGPILVAQDSFSLAARPSTGVPGSFQTPGLAGFGGGPAAGGLPSIAPPVGFNRQGRSIDFNLSYIDDLSLNLLISATQASRRSIVLTAPRVTFFNGQRAYVFVARQISFISDLEPVPDAGGFDPTLSVLSSGVVLEVEGTVSADRRFVTMTVEPSLATVIQPIRRIQQTAIVDVPQLGGDPAQGVDDPQQIISGFIEAPEIEITVVKATVSVPDQGTLLMGGQRLVGEIEVEAGVPMLSKVPILNRLFTNRSKTKDERTLLILVKPTIIIQAEEEEKLFPGLVQQ